MGSRSLRTTPALAILVMTGLLAVGCGVAPGNNGDNANTGYPSTWWATGILGEAAPRFTLNDTDGESFSLTTQLASRSVVIAFMPGCT